MSIAQSARAGSPPAALYSFGLLPEHAWPDPNLSTNAKIILGGLVLIARGRQVFHATNREVAKMCAVCERSVMRGIGELEERGYASRNSIGPRFSFEFQLRRGERSVVPFSVMSVATAPMTGQSPPPDSPVTAPMTGQSPLSIRDEIRETKPDGEPVRLWFENEPEPEPLKQPPPDPPKPIGDDEFLVDLIKRGTLTIPETSAEDVRRTAKLHGRNLVSEALDIAEAATGPIRGWGYVLGIISKRKAEIARAAKPRNHNPVEKTKALTVDDVPAGEDLAEWIRKASGIGVTAVVARLMRAGLLGWVAKGLVPRELIPAELLEPEYPPGARNKTDCGSTCKVPPQPVGAPSPDTQDYSLHKRANQITSNSGRGQFTPRDSNPPVPAGQPDSPPGRRGD